MSGTNSSRDRRTTVKKGKEKMTVSDRIDQIVTNRILGIPIFIAVMFVVYYISVTTIGTIVTDWTNDVFVVAIQDVVSGFLTAIGTGDLVQSLVVDGIIGGVGAVLGSCPRWRSFSCFCPCWRTAVTWFASLSSWIGCSAISGCPERASSRC